MRAPYIGSLPIALACGSLLLQHISAQKSPTLTTLYSFRGQPDGGSPWGGVVWKSGALYGTGYSGGASGYGAIFALTPADSPGGTWTEAVCYSFAGRPDGANPEAGLVASSNEVLYGTTYWGGSFGGGSVFALTPPVSPGGPCTETILYSFTGGVDGGNPWANLAVGKDGALYGTTVNGGTSGAGTVFSLKPSASPGETWTETALYSFTNSTDGADPIAGVVIGENGALYGTTSSGGCCLNSGIIFVIAPPVAPGAPWMEYVLHRFAGDDDGSVPGGGLVIGPGGVLYGTTIAGGRNCSDSDNGCGTVFKLTPPTSQGASWKETVLYRFAGGSDGANPRGRLLIGKDGALYGTTAGGNIPDCSFGCGTIFELNPLDSTENVLHTFTNGDGSSPHGNVISRNGKLYGTTLSGGASGDGTVFELTY